MPTTGESTESVPIKDVPIEGDALARRVVLAGFGAVAAAVVLSACGRQPAGGPPGGAPGGSGGDESGGAGSTGSSAPVTTDTSAIPVGGGKIFDRELVVVTQPVEGQFKAFSAICTHQGCPVASVRGGNIICPCHGSHFSITDGSVTSGPARTPLPALPITVSDGRLTVT